MERQDQRRLGEILLGRKVITGKQLEDALKEQEATGRLLGEILVSHQLASELDVAQALSEEFGFAYVDLETMAIDQAALKMVPEDMCVQHRAIPVFEMKGVMTLALANPLKADLIKRFEEASGCRIKPVIATCAAVHNALAKHFNRSSDHLAEAAKTGVAGGAPGDRPPANVTTVINLVRDIIAEAVDSGASDIHFEPERSSFVCRFRVDGVLYRAREIPSKDQGAVTSRVKIMSDMDIAEKRLPQDGKVRMMVNHRDVDLRISSFPTIHGENIVIRILDRTGGLLELGQLGFSKPELETLRDLIASPYGIILVTGPTGSGKTTTLYAALNSVNTPDKNIMTLEDPVEYEIPYIRQSQVNVKAGLTFARGLRSLVRQDPDIILIGEIRDKETADIAVHAALTGHLVFSTLHTNDAPSAVSRLIDMGVEPFLVSSAIRGILAQRLVRMLCPHCKKESAFTEDVLRKLGIAAGRFAEFKDRSFFEAAGCDRCKGRGYISRTGIYELMVVDEALQCMLAGKASANTIREQALKNGMRPLRDSALEKVLLGVTSVSEVLRVTEEV
jgi:type IV pilus assembly protein PilB